MPGDTYYSKALQDPRTQLGTETQVIPGNDQNMCPTNQKPGGSKLERTS